MSSDAIMSIAERYGIRLYTTKPRRGQFIPPHMVIATREDFVRFVKAIVEGEK